MPVDQNAHPPLGLRRQELAGQVEGLRPPPVPVQVKMLPTSRGWTFLVYSRGGHTAAIEAWLGHLLPHRVTVGSGLTPRVVRAEFRTLPQPLQPLANPGLHHVDLSPSGSVSAYVATPGPGPMADARQPRTSTPELTPRQHEILAAAVAMGYYDIPHGLTLRQLAQRLGTTASSVSEVLRRAECSIIRAYAAERSLQTWLARQGEARDPPELEPGAPLVRDPREKG